MKTSRVSQSQEVQTRGYVSTFCILHVATSVPYNTVSILLSQNDTAEWAYKFNHRTRQWGWTNYYLRVGLLLSEWEESFVSATSYFPIKATDISLCCLLPKAFPLFTGEWHWNHCCNIVVGLLMCVLNLPCFYTVSSWGCTYFLKNDSRKCALLKSHMTTFSLLVQRPNK